MEVVEVAEGRVYEQVSKLREILHHTNARRKISASSKQGLFFQFHKIGGLLILHKRT
jgi:hypothetical protein